MATQTAAPPESTEDKPQSPASEVVQSTLEVQHDAKAEATKGISSPSVFVSSEPMREEQVQNAVKFLSHPKVSGSPVVYRRSFLERKGLTKEEIDEAFRRVPDPPQAVSSAQPASTNQDGHMQSLSNSQPRVSTQTLQPSNVAPAGVISKVGTLTQSRFHWSYALLAVGFLAVSGAGTAVVFKKAVVPRLKSWIRKVVFEEEEGESTKKTNSKPSLEEEATAAAKAAAAAAADVARASQEMLISKTEEKKYFEELRNLIGVQVQEMKSMSNALQKLEGQGNNPGRTLVEQDYRVSTSLRQSNGNGKADFDLYSGQGNNPGRTVVEQDHRVSTSLSQSNGNGKADFDLYSGRSSPPPPTLEPSVAPHPKSYMEIMAMVQRGEKPPNVREINDLPPNPNQPLPNSHSAPRAKPWEVGQTQNSFSQVLQSHESSNGLTSNLQDYGVKNQLNGDSSLPWWQRKNVRIAEIENDEEQKSGSSGVLSNERPVLRQWVPPQPPPVAMAEAAVAIRQPKKPLSQKQLGSEIDDPLVVNPSDGIDELQRITKISELGGAVDANGGNSDVSRQFAESGVVVDINGGILGMNTSEIQEE